MESEYEGFNKLIREFAPEIKVDTCEYGDHFMIPVGKICYEWDFHQDWNALMAVVKKIKPLADFNKGGEIIIKINSCLISWDINKVHNAVIEFIKWHNKNK